MFFIKNLKTDTEKEVRIYQVSKEGSIVGNSQFTLLDPLGMSIGIILLPANSISCDGALNRAGIIDVQSTESFEITIPNGPTVTATGIDDFIVKMRDLGFDVTVMDEFVPPAPISCEGANGTVTFEDAGNWWDEAHPNRKCIITLTINDEQSITFDANKEYVTDAVESNVAFQDYLDEIGLTITLSDNLTKMKSTSDTPIRFKFELDRSQSEIDPTIDIGAIYTELNGGAVDYNLPNEMFGCLIKSAPVISCVGATPGAYWDNGVTVNGNYTLAMTWTMDGVNETNTITGSAAGKDLGRLVRDAASSFTGLYTNWDGFTRIELLSFGDGDYNPLLETVRIHLITDGTIITNESPEDELSPAIQLSPNSKEMLICLKQETLPVINCVGESNFVDWNGPADVFGNYEMIFIETKNLGEVTSTMVSGFTDFGKNIIAISNQHANWPPNVDCNGDGNTRIESNLFNGGDIRVRIAADQGFNFNSAALREGSSTVNQYVDDRDWDVIEFCLHTEPGEPEQPT